MATLEVASPFTVQLEPEPPEGVVRPPGAPTKFTFPAPGTYNDVPDEVAAHPYTQMYLVGYEPPPLASSPDTIVMVPEPEGELPPPDEGGVALSQTRRRGREEREQPREV